MDNASNMNPTCDIVLYANNLLILDCVNPKTDPMIKENKLLNINMFFQEKSAWSDSV